MSRGSRGGPVQPNETCVHRSGRAAAREHAFAARLFRDHSRPIDSGLNRRRARVVGEEHVVGAGKRGEVSNKRARLGRGAAAQRQSALGLGSADALFSFHQATGAVTFPDGVATPCPPVSKAQPVEENATSAPSDRAASLRVVIGRRPHAFASTKHPAAFD